MQPCHFPASYQQTHLSDIKETMTTKQDKEEAAASLLGAIYGDLASLMQPDPEPTLHFNPDIA